jgi:hypothetical protein
MRRLLVLLAAVGGLAAVTAPSASAAPSDLQIGVAGKAQLVSPNTVNLPVTYNCPASYGFGTIDANVAQASTGAAGVGTTPVTCTGQATTVVITINQVNGNLYELGQAIASARLGVWTQAVSQTRRIQIVG